ncbi:MAG: ATP-binding protein [Blastochloris sp.]|nr:ATP-binding protein [Blastochloris sp.]
MKSTEVRLLPWAREIIALYQSSAGNQFILHGNLQDRFLLPEGEAGRLGELQDYLRQTLLPGFDVILSYDLGNGVRVEKGGELLSQWPAYKERPELPKAPRQAVEFLTRYFRYCANLARLGQKHHQVACLIPAVHLLAPAVPGSLNYDLNALALLMREWATDPLLTSHSLATFLLTDTLNDLHPLLVHNPRATLCKVPLPEEAQLVEAFRVFFKMYPQALQQFQDELEPLARQMKGASLGALETMLRRKDYLKEALQAGDVAGLKKAMVERDSNDLIEFIESKKTLDDLHGQEVLKTLLRQDFQLWKENDLQAMPMGYLICGPVGTGKTYMVECLAGEAGVPVLKIKNFRDKWVGTSESNLEKIFGLLQALGRCFVFIDEADQALGRRDSGANDSGLSGRIYSMFAKEMSNSANRGKIVWVLASSRPDLIEVDLKRPGRLDVKIPIFPASTPEEAFGLLRALCKRRSVVLVPEDFETLKPLLPQWLTPGAAEALAVKIYRNVKVNKSSPLVAAQLCLKDYQHPVPMEVLRAQILLAVKESTDIEFVPKAFRGSELDS